MSYVSCSSMSSLIIVGTSLFVGALVIRGAIRAVEKTGPIGLRMKGLMTSYYRGGFEPKMTPREAARILGVSPSAPLTAITEAHIRLMLRNHPDRGGSPYIATKINDAKKMLVEQK